ncbi:MAG TPA: O-antigen ligase family protein [Acidimicrobiia bacterium]|nr:O-antigen ligase family protein [Acidimicrobiia bacterium]
MSALVVPGAILAAFVLAVAFLDAAVAAALIAALVFTRVPAVLLHSDSIAPMVLAGVLGAVASARWRRLDGGRNRRALGFGLAGVTYLAVLALSYLWASDPQATASAVQKLALVIVIAVGFVATLQDTRALRFATGAIMAGGVFLALLSLHQVVSAGYHRTYGGFAVAQIENIVGTTNAYRIGGPFGDPNFFGQLMLLPVAFGLQRLAAARSFGRRALATVVVGLCGATVLLTYSRGALIALIVVLVIWLWTTPTPRARTLIVVCGVGALLVGSLVLPSAYRERISQVQSVVPGLGSRPGTTSDDALRGRESAVIVGLRMFADHPLGGVGAGNFQSRYLDYAASVGLYRSGQPLAPHSLVTQVASETGLIGVIAFGSIVVGAFAALRRSRQDLLAIGQAENARLVAAIRNALVGYLVASLFLHAAYPQTLWLLLALAWATPQCVRRPRREATVLPLKKPGLLTPV